MNFEKIDNLVKDVLDSPKIDISRWKRFKIGDLFNLIGKGKDTITHQKEGNIPCVIAKNNNNGVGGYIEKANKLFSANKIVVVCQGQGGAGLAWYMDIDFCANACVAILEQKFKLNKSIGLFLTSIMSYEWKPKYNHEKGLNNKHLLNETIPLPIDKNGNPDWQYMENFMKSRERDEKSIDFSRLENLPKEICKTNITNFKNIKSFKMIDLFEISGTKTTSKNKVLQEGQYNYITTKASNNGVDGYSNFYTENGNVLTVDSAVAGFMSYQDKNFIASDHVEKLTPKFNLNKWIGLFICSVWNALYMFKKYNYTLKAAQKQIKEESIPLPSKNNQPDWEYMENYIKEKYDNMLSKLL